MSMFPELDERLEYASKKGEKLIDDSVAFISEAVHFSQRPCPGKAGVVEMVAKLKRKIPIEFRIDAGLVVNELKSILDAVACQRAVECSKKSNGTYFPISKNQMIFDIDGRKKMKLLSLEDQEYISSLRPWAAGHHILYKLHEADRVRKHTKLLSCGSTPRVRPIGSGMIHYLQIRNSERLHNAGDEVIICEYSLKNTTGVHIETYISYNEPDILRDTAVGQLMHDSVAVVKEIINHFR